MYVHAVDPHRADKSHINPLFLIHHMIWNNVEIKVLYGFFSLCQIVASYHTECTYILTCITRSTLHGLQILDPVEVHGPQATYTRICVLHMPRNHEHLLTS